LSEKIKLAAALPTFSAGGDRFVPDGYGEKRGVPEMFAIAKTIEGLEGVELVGTWHVNNENIDEVKQLSRYTGIKIIDIVVDIWSTAKWSRGALTSRDSKLRKEAVTEIKKNIDWAAELDCPLINIWPAQDGFDYPFSASYDEVWDNLIETLSEVMEYQKKVKKVRVGIEPKVKEPRKYSFVATIGKTLLLINEVNSSDLGMVLDVGHALYAYENMAMSAVLAHRAGKLFHLHLNDNYRFWDDDMYPASVHTIEYLELLYWLEKMKYNGYYSLDINPYREDSVQVVRESFAWILGLRRILDKIGYETIAQKMEKENHVAVTSLIRQMMLP